MRGRFTQTTDTNRPAGAFGGLSVQLRIKERAFKTFMLPYKGRHKVMPSQKFCTSTAILRVLEVRLWIIPCGNSESSF